MLALRTRGMRPQAKIRWQPQRLKRQGRILPQGLCQHLDSDPRHTDLELLASGTVREYISVFSHAAHG